MNAIALPDHHGLPVHHVGDFTLRIPLSDGEAPEEHSDEYVTPRFITSAAERVFGGRIDLDPCSNPIANQVVNAERFFTVEDDCLRLQWHAENIWLNPPFSNPLQFIKRLTEQYARGNFEQAIVLIHHDSVEWARVLQQHCTAICTFFDRVQFLKRLNNGELKTMKKYPRPVCAYYIGDNVLGFAREFSHVGFVYQPVFMPSSARVRRVCV